MAKKPNRRRPGRDLRRRHALAHRGTATTPNSGADDDLDAVDWEAERQHCPLDDHCAGCDRTDNLRTVISVFGDEDFNFNTAEVACATTCPEHDGVSFLRLRDIGPGRFAARVRAHQRHRT
ncbi:hypothetical protein [Pseudonocardia sp. ICBG601]|uniref:hypothetical protein n=1 Tax=Pseudonocardia sp. ICBG601 TaxID=2846759 RepID=UPI001CF701D9|nr:hypothetical protein [Pseudonocardia sp. ICBG601]